MEKQNELAFQQSDGSELMPEVVNEKVDARAVHEALEVKSNFRDWIKNRITEFGFVEGEDFYSKFSETPLGGRPRTDYIVSLDMAKELAMVERNEMGRKMRRYFIECEKRLHQTAPQAQALPSEALRRLQAINAGVIEELGNQHVRIADLERLARPGPEWMSPAGWCEKHGYALPACGRLGRASTLLSQASAGNNVPVGREKRMKPDGRRAREVRSFAPWILDELMPPMLARFARQAEEQKKGGAK